jgi:hypothetical protein
MKAQTRDRKPAKRLPRNSKAESPAIKDRRAFICELELRTESYLFEVFRFKDPTTKARRPARIMEDRVFRAIVNIRVRGWKEEIVRDFQARPRPDYSGADLDTRQRSEILERTIAHIANELKSPPDPEDEQILGKAFVDAVKRGDLKRLSSLHDLCALYENKALQAPSNGDSRSWHYYTGLAALHFLRRGVLPFKRTVRERALEESALSEFYLLAPIERWSVAIEEKRKELKGAFPKKKTWARIFKDLGLDGLPSAPTRPTTDIL